MKKIVLIVICILIITFIFSVKLYMSFLPNLRIHSPYIAHAGGIIDGYKYTNSKEAVLNSLRHGIQYIELDLALTSDGYVVASHDWSVYDEKESSHVPTLKEFRTKKIFNRFTPLLVDDIIELLKTNKDMYLITDKISDPKIIDKYFSKYKNRVGVECYRLEDYIWYKNNGYYLAMYNMFLSKKDVLIHNIKYVLGFENYKYDACVCEDKMLDYGIFLSLAKCVYSLEKVNTKHDADSIMKMHNSVEFVYIDDCTK